MAQARALAGVRAGNKHRLQYFLADNGTLMARRK